MDFLKLFHILFIFVWIGSLLTLTRLLAYIAQESPEMQIKLSKICRRMYFFVDLPSMIMVLALGISVIIGKGVDMKAGWLHMKWTFAFLLILCDLITGRQIVKLGRAPIKGKGTLFKIFHGMTALFLIGALASIYIIKQRGSL